MPAGAVSPWECKCAQCVARCFLALVAGSGVAGNLRMRWDGDNHSGKLLKAGLL